MFVCLSLCGYVYVYAYVYMYIWVCGCVYVCVCGTCVCLYVCVCGVCVYVWGYVNVCMCMSMCGFVDGYAVTTEARSFRSSWEWSLR